MMHTDPKDVLSARIMQARAALFAIASNYDDTLGAYTMSDELMRYGLWAVQELLDQAKSAHDTIVDEDIAAKDKETYAGEPGGPPSPQMIANLEAVLARWKREAGAAREAVKGGL